MFYYGSDGYWVISQDIKSGVETQAQAADVAYRGDADAGIDILSKHSGNLGFTSNGESLHYLLLLMFRVLHYITNIESIIRTTDEVLHPCKIRSMKLWNWFFEWLVIIDSFDFMSSAWAWACPLTYARPGDILCMPTSCRALRISKLTVLYELSSAFETLSKHYIESCSNPCLSLQMIW